MAVKVEAVDYHNPVHAHALIEMLDHYAQDPMGGGEALPESTKAVLIKEMAARDTVFSFLAWNEEGQAVGLVNCVIGFSTFAAKPVCNIHDIAIRSGLRGQGLAQKLMQAVVTEAKARGCCKLTLEVLTGNEPAKLAYKKFGFAAYQLDPATGSAEFWEYKL
ncbi:GNAT family N-acetyltransferase [Aliidiomarina taiwanensis]|uniref:GNAT family N-acetyltransferase n=1 Tax=Aliidiomarina taiwanensis TaxID=946228 RepID=A0A432X8N3_9GAMM|nr:GNAT family N-acetyltransferase [Aliidiomarina taiwanensis]RUO43680.1 GNAT family N-acetyltransferase [Aliidiomarina taiwanensis]